VKVVSLKDEKKAVKDVLEKAIAEELNPSCCSVSRMGGTEL
jgi:hypothetical protein